MKRQITLDLSKCPFLFLVLGNDGKFLIRGDFLQSLPCCKYYRRRTCRLVIGFPENVLDCVLILLVNHDAKAMSDSSTVFKFTPLTTLFCSIFALCNSVIRLVVSDACDLPAIRSCLGSVQSAYNFFNIPKSQNTEESDCPILKLENKKTIMYHKLGTAPQDCTYLFGFTTGSYLRLRNDILKLGQCKYFFFSGSILNSDKESNGYPRDSIYKFSYLTSKSEFASCSLSEFTLN